jgi:hypothetical protein
MHVIDFELLILWVWWKTKKLYKSRIWKILYKESVLELVFVAVAEPRTSAKASIEVGP